MKVYAAEMPGYLEMSKVRCPVRAKFLSLRANLT